jgi:hypothetical protein
MFERPPATLIPLALPVGTHLAPPRDSVVIVVKLALTLKQGELFSMTVPSGRRMVRPGLGMVKAPVAWMASGGKTMVVPEGAALMMA